MVQIFGTRTLQLFKEYKFGGDIGPGKTLVLYLDVSMLCRRRGQFLALLVDDRENCQTNEHKRASLDLPCFY